MDSNKKEIFDEEIYLKHYDKITGRWVTVESFLRAEYCEDCLKKYIEKYPTERFAIQKVTTIFREV